MNESRVNVIQGHALTELRKLPAESVQCCVTSPAYFGLREYGTEPQIWGGDADCEHEWDDAGTRRNRWGLDSGASEKQQSNRGNAWEIGQGAFCSRCGAWRGELGLEPTISLYVEHLVSIFRELHRVLRKDGVFFLNIGDSYAGSGNGSNDYRPEDASISKNSAKYRGQRPGAGRADGKVDERGQRNRDGLGAVPGLKPKSLCGIPWRVAFALQEDGWWLRSDIIWAKGCSFGPYHGNPMPESVKDRPTRSHEYVFMLTKSARYFYDAEEVKEPAKTGEWDAMPHIGGVKQAEGSGNRTYSGNQPSGGGTRNLRDVWTIPTQANSLGHFAIMPEKLVEPCIKAATRPDDLVLDPFAGAGTVGKVALGLGRRFIGIELNPEYVELIRQRLDGVQLPMGLLDVAS